tara:strand:- start:901 stop:1110 length:210 start_codon:yes stop_codon:yes gene_type:complete
MTLQEFGLMINNLNHKSDYIRVGQHLFNYLAMFFPTIGESYRGQELDPFYDDDNVLPFLQDLLENHVSL